jgi:hypothetical protein
MSDTPRTDALVNFLDAIKTCGEIERDLTASRAMCAEFAKAMNEALKLLDKGAAGWGVSKDILRLAIAKYEKEQSNG